MRLLPVQALQGADMPDLIEQIAQRRQVEIPFQQGGRCAEMRIGLIQQPPHRTDDIRPVSIDEQVFGLLKMSGDRLSVMYQARNGPITTMVPENRVAVSARVRPARPAP